MAMVLDRCLCSVGAALLPRGPGCQPGCKSLLIWDNCEGDWATSSWEPPSGRACLSLPGWHLFSPLLRQRGCSHLAARMSHRCIRYRKITSLRGLYSAPFKIPPVKLKIRHSCLRCQSQATPIWVSFQDGVSMFGPVFICFKPFGWKESSCAAKTDLHVT